MQVKSILECSKLSTFIKLPFVFVLSIFEWPLKTGFTACIFRVKNTVDPNQMADDLDQLCFQIQDQTLLWTCIAKILIVYRHIY